MQAISQVIKEKMLEYTKLFSIEPNTFQGFVIVYDYIGYLNKQPLTKDLLQRIFTDTARLMGQNSIEAIDEDKLLDVKGLALSQEFWTYYGNLEIIHDKMKRIQKCRLEDKEEFEKLCHLFSKPYSKQMLELSFRIINSEVFDRLDQQSFKGGDEHETETMFNDEKSILYVRGEPVFINIQDKITNAHKILHHIFITNKGNITDDFYFAEIAEDEFGDLNYKAKPRNWKRYWRTCEYINQKIEEQTKDSIKDFLVFNTGKHAKIKINRQYL